MPAADLAPFGDQQAVQHTRTGEWVLKVQPIESIHDRNIGFRHRPWQVVDATTADVEGFRLFRDGQIVRAVDQRFALSNPALVSAPSKKNQLGAARPLWGQKRGTARVPLEGSGRPVFGGV